MSLGIALIILGVVLLIVSIVLLIVYVKKGSEISVEDFDKKFEIESNLNPARVELASKRKEAAQLISSQSLFNRNEIEVDEFVEIQETEKLIDE